MKRILSIVLTLTMLLGVLCLPFEVSAAEATATVTEDNTVYTEVATLDQFVAALAAKQNIKLTADITLAKNTKYQLYTTTTLNGNGHTIYIPEMDNSTNAPFAWAVDTSMPNYQSTTTIKNVNFGSADQPFVHTNTSSSTMGLFTGIVSGYYTAWENVNVYYEMTTPKAVFVGAIMPSAGGTHTFNNCNVFVSIENHSSAAGGWIGEIAGDCSVTMTNCNTYGRLSNVASTAGGFTGMLKGSLSLTNCNNYANIGSTSTAGAKFAVGGFVPYATNTTKKIELVNCINYGEVAGNENAGGILGFMGEVPASATITLTDCANYGKIKAWNGNAGGIAGTVSNATFTRCVNYATVTSFNAGGFVGQANAIGAVDCLNVGKVIGERMGASGAGGFFGTVGSATMTNCANVGIVEQVNGSTYGTGNIAGQLTGTLTMTDCMGLGAVLSSRKANGVFVGNASSGSVATTNCKFIASNGESAEKVGKGTTRATESEAIELLKTKLKLDFIKGDNGLFQLAAPTLRGVQTTAANGNAKSARLIATIGRTIKTLDKVGFDIVCTQNGQQIMSESKATMDVYTMVNNGFGTNAKQITADSLGGTYLYTVEIKNIPTTDATLVVKVKPWTTDGTNTWYGEEMTLTFVNGNYVEGIMDKTENQLDPLLYGSPLPRRVDSVLYQKSALFCGDSICFGSQDRGVYSGVRGWAGRIGYVHDMDFVNAGVSSSSVSNARLQWGTIIQQVEANKNRNFDYVLLHGGVNDAWGTNGSAPTPVGKVTAEGTTTFDLNTFAGGLENLLYKTKQIFPNAKIGYIINFYAPNCTSGTVSEMSAYVDMTKVICDKYDVPYVDLYNNAELTEKLMVTVPGHKKDYIADNIHPGAAGYDVLYQYIAAWMETTLSGVTESTPAPTSTLTLGGVDISKYTIVYARSKEAQTVKSYWRPEYDPGQETANRLAALIKEKFGVELKVYSDVNAPETEYEILIGKTNRKETTTASLSSLAIDNYTTKMVGNKLVICGGAAGTIYHAVDPLETYFNSTVANNQYAIASTTDLSGTYHLERIAILGDSITYGAISTDYKTNGAAYGYPKQIGRMYWQECLVTAYGLPGVKLTEYTSQAVWSNFQKQSAKEPFDKVIVMLGINDANVVNTNGGQWTDKNDQLFKTSMKLLVKAILKANTDAEVMVMTCAVHYRTPSSHPNNHIFSSPRIVELQKECAAALKAEGYNVHLFDMDAYSRDHTTIDMFNADRLHPNDEGHEALAQGVVAALKLLKQGKTDKYLLY